MHRGGPSVRRLLVATCVVLAAGCAGPGGGAPVAGGAPGPTAGPGGASRTPEELARDLGDAVWRVEVDGCGVEGGGTAFVIAPDLLVTNRHVVAFDVAPTLTDRSGARTLEGRVIGMGEAVDLAVIRVDAALAPVLKWAPTALLAEGEPVVALGYPDPLNTFTVTPGTLNAFDVVDGVRIGIVSDEASDHGSSGGPLLTAEGMVAGVVTEFLGGTQNAGLSLSHDAVRGELAAILASPAEPVEDCDGATYGTDAALDLLWDWCADGGMWACDELFVASPAGSDYEWFGATCGDLVETDDWCTVAFDASEPTDRGDDAGLDALWDACAGDGPGWPADCDLLFRVAPAGSAYRAHADGCGGRVEPAGWCEERFG